MIVLPALTWPDEEASFTVPSRTPSGHGLSGPWRRLNSSTNTARTRRRSAGSAMTVAVAGRSATTPCLRWKVNCGWAARLASQLRVLGPGIPLR